MQWNLGYHTADIAPNVQHAYVAYAANERRLPFAQTDIPSATSVIFPGVDTDVGGGNGNTGLNDLSLLDVRYGQSFRPSVETRSRAIPIQMRRPTR